MAENPTHLEIHTGKMKKIRAQVAAPTSPSPITGDIYFDTSTNLEAIGIRVSSGWVYISTIR